MVEWVEAKCKVRNGLYLPLSSRSARESESEAPHRGEHTDRHPTLQPFELPLQYRRSQQDAPHAESSVLTRTWRTATSIARSCRPAVASRASPFRCITSPISIRSSKAVKRWDHADFDRDVAWTGAASSLPAQRPQAVLWLANVASCGQPGRRAASTRWRQHWPRSSDDSGQNFCEHKAPGSSCTKISSARANCAKAPFYNTFAYEVSWRARDSSVWRLRNLNILASRRQGWSELQTLLPLQQ